MENLKTILHGDDLATVGTPSGVKWLKDALEKLFEIITPCIGPGAVLNNGKVAAAT